MDNLVGVVMPTGTLIGGYLAMGGGGSIEKTTIHFTNDSGTITCDKTMAEIIEAYNSGALMDGVMFDVESGVYAVLDLFVAQDMGDFLLVQFSCIGDNGDNSITYIIIGTSYDGEDSWNLTIRNLASISDLQNYQLLSSKVTTIDSSSSDASYPSAKAVYDYKNKVVDLSSYSLNDTITNTEIIQSLLEPSAIVNYNGSYLTLSTKNTQAGLGDLYYFVGLFGESALVIVLLYTNNIFVVGAIETIGIQLRSNLVTSISSSSTDTQYPSAKCVYDMIGNVETILNTLNSGGGAS